MIHLTREGKSCYFVLILQNNIIYLSKNNSKLLWQALQPMKKQIENNITANQWFEYAKSLYEKEFEAESPL